MLFYSLIAAPFEYCVIVWHFGSPEKMKKPERIQKQALRYVSKDFNSSYEQLLSRSNRNTLYVQRLRLNLSIVYKSGMKQGPMYVNYVSFSYQASHFWNVLDNCWMTAENGNRSAIGQIMILVF